MHRETIPPISGRPSKCGNVSTRFKPPTFRLSPSSLDHASYMSKGAGGVKEGDRGGSRTRVLASAVKSRREGSVEGECLSDQSGALFERQQTRAFWFGLLILASTNRRVDRAAGRRARVWQQQQLQRIEINFVSSVPTNCVRPSPRSGSCRKPRTRQDPGAAETKGVFRVHRPECRRLSSLIENVLDFLPHRAGAETV